MSFCSGMFNTSYIAIAGPSLRFEPIGCHALGIYGVYRTRAPVLHHRWIKVLVLVTARTLERYCPSTSNLSIVRGESGSPCFKVLHVEVELEVGTGSSHNLISQYDSLIFFARSLLHSQFSRCSGGGALHWQVVFFHDLRYLFTRYFKNQHHQASHPPDFRAEEMGVNSQYIATGVENIFQDVIRPFAKDLIKGLEHNVNSGWDNMMKHDGYSLRSFMSLNTGSYDRALSEAVLDSLGFVSIELQTFGDRMEVFRMIELADAGLNMMQKNALRKLQYGPSIKVGMRFRSAWWTELVDITGGRLSADLPIQTIIYPSHSAESSTPSTVLIASYYLTDDAERLGALINAGKVDNDEELKELVLHHLAEVYNVDYGFLLNQCFCVRRVPNDDLRLPIPPLQM
ncbi:hypothetical protein BD769DRAFT_1636430 [Suillus cothurnatus]|nr:hypothetical protein BD769DRAFT_1636430 [Suillus cothurnatus]